MSEFANYREKVLAYYKSQASKMVLSNRLQNPSPANLKKQLEARLSEGLNQEDLRIIKEFCDPVNRYQTLAKAIEMFPSERFKSVQNFMLEKTKEPQDLIVKLLAILIDFKPRPFQLGLLEKGQQSPAIAAQNSPHTANEDHEANPKFTANTRSVVPAKRNGVYIWFLAALLVLGIGGFGVYKKNQKQCMCWVEDHYQAVSCSENSPGVLTLALDQHRLNHFKKITRPDTLTEKHHHQVWYSKVNNQVEFFTAPGFHPIYTDRSLRAATAYIIKKYAIKSSDEL